MEINMENVRCTSLENELFYGNLTYIQTKEAKDLVKSYLPIIKKFTSQGYVYPDDDTSIKEIDFLKTQFTPEIILDKSHRHLIQDDDLFVYLKEANKQLGLNNDEYEKIEKLLFKVINPIILHLKRYWNRARPYQYAFEYNKDFHPLTTISGNSPSYPSGHTMCAETWAYIMKSKHPELSERIDIIKEDISQSRINMGVHFPSDIQFGKQIIDFLWSHNLINKQ